MAAGATHCLESASVHYWDLILVLFIVSLNVDDFILPGHNVMGFEFVENKPVGHEVYVERESEMKLVQPTIMFALRVSLANRFEKDVPNSI